MTAPRHALRSELDAAAGVLTDAFANDPWFNWLYPSVEQWPSDPNAWFALVLGRAFAKGHTFVTDSGATNWIPPDVHFPEGDDIDLAVGLLQSQIGERAGAALGVIGQGGTAFPDTPRFHCVYVGVSKSAQGRGIGGALMARVLDICDRDGFPASLTSTNDVNLPWYRSLGFNEIGEVAVPGADFKLRPMWRDPRTLG
ncbi:MAG: GNAT family N-acetyltransferase [Ilumatobacteraceae bacterium]